MTITVSCNKPRVRHVVALQRLLHKKWIANGDLFIEVCDGRINIEGRGWPLVYRIPEDIAPSFAYPGMSGLAAPVELNGLLADISPYLKEQLVVTATGDKLGYWAVTPGRSVLRFVGKPDEAKDHDYWYRYHSLCIGLRQVLCAAGISDPDAHKQLVQEHEFLLGEQDNGSQSDQSHDSGDGNGAGN